MNKLDAYLAAVIARDNAMLMFAAVVMAAAVLMVLYHRPRGDRQFTLKWESGFAAVGVLGIVIRVLVWLLPENLWYDEAFTAAVVRAPISDAWTAIMADVHPPLWYAITWPFVRLLGPSELVLRLPALLCSLAALLVFDAWIDEESDNLKVFTVAFGLMALAPVGIRYTAEARCYAALQLAAVMAFYGASRGRRGLFLAGAVAAPWLHHMGWLIALPACMVWIYRRAQHPGNGWQLAWLAVILASPAAVIAGLQVFGSGLGQGMIQSGYWIQDRGLGAYLYHAVFQQIFSTCTAPKGLLEWAAGLMTLGIWVVAWYGAIRSRRWSLALMAFGPGLAVFAISFIKPLLLGRTLIGATPPLYLLAAHGLDRLRLRRWSWIGSVGVVTALMLVAVGRQVTGHARGEITGLFEATRTCQTVTHSEPSSVVLAGYYAPDQHNVLWDGFEPGLQTGAMTLETEQALGIERGPLDADCLIYADHPAVPRENLLTLDPERERRQLVYTLTDDEFSHIALYRR